MRKPKIGDIVIYTGRNIIFHYPAIVTGSRNCDDYDLQLFVIKTTGTEHISCVEFSADKEENTWSWPKEEKQEEKHGDNNK